jgi:hypothetical protein
VLPLHDAMLAGFFKPPLLGQNLTKEQKDKEKW